MIETFAGWWESQKGILWTGRAIMTMHDSMAKEAAEKAWFEGKRQARELMKLNDSNNKNASEY
jgi:hypothetical protein